MPKLSARMRPKSPESARNGKTKAVTLQHGGSGRNSIMQARLDLRSRAGKAFIAEVAALKAHLGETLLTAPVTALVEQAARLALLEHIAWAELSRAEALTKGGVVHAAFEPFLRASRDRRAVLVMLGLERKQKEIPDLKQYLEAQYGDATSD